jgi:hypothetical protein
VTTKNGFESDIILGDRYRDTVSGYEGVATAAVFFLHGCERVTLEQWIEHAGEMRELTFDAPRLKHLMSGEMATSTRTGGSRPTPPRSGTTRA